MQLAFISIIDCTYLPFAARAYDQTHGCPLWEFAYQANPRKWEWLAPWRSTTIALSCVKMISCAASSLAKLMWLLHNLCVPEMGWILQRHATWAGSHIELKPNSTTFRFNSNSIDFEECLRFVDSQIYDYFAVFDCQSALEWSWFLLWHPLRRLKFTSALRTDALLNQGRREISSTWFQIGMPGKHRGQESTRCWQCPLPHSDGLLHGANTLDSHTITSAKRQVFGPLKSLDHALVPSTVQICLPHRSPVPVESQT